MFYPSRGLYAISDIVVLILSLLISVDRGFRCERSGTETYSTHISIPFTKENI